MKHLKSPLPIFNTFGLLLTFLVFGFSCKPPNSEFTTSKISLRFSEDTVYFDTLISTVTSVTKRLKVYNENPKAVKISKIELSNTSNAFSLTVNGLEASAFEQTDLLAGDSLLVLLKANLKEQNQNLPFVVEESLSFTTNGLQQNIPIIAWGQDAHFLRDSVLVCNSTWSAGKPYVIYDDILVDSLCSLTIKPGTHIYSHYGSYIYVKGTLHSNGTAQSSVVFTNDRFDSGFDTSPGQWGGIVFLEGSKDNSLRFTQIRNAYDAIWLGTPDTDTIPDLVLNNSIIENTAGSGILAFTSDLLMTNCLIDNCADFVFAGLAGGNYILKHNTLANLGYGFFRTQPVMVLTNNLQLSDGSVLLDDLTASMQNCIVWGNQSDELVLVSAAGKLFNVSIHDNLLRTQSASLGDNNLVNQDPLFVQTSEFNYRIDTLSPAIDAGIDLGITIDLDSLQRDSMPDLGAYEWRQN